MSYSMRGRVIIRKKGCPIPKISISDYYRNFKIYKDLSLEELVSLISEKRKCLSYTKEEKEVNRIKTEIKLLEDLYTIKRSDSITLFNRYREENKDMFFTSELGVTANCILNYLGYRTPIYTEECIKMAECIDKDKLILGDIQNEVAGCIVKEILEHYNAKFDEQKIIDNYDLDEIKFYDYFTSIHNWCKTHYWRN